MSVKKDGVKIRTRPGKAIDRHHAMKGRVFDPNVKLVRAAKGSLDYVGTSGLWADYDSQKVRKPVGTTRPLTDEERQTILYELARKARLAHPRHGHPDHTTESYEAPERTL